MSNPFATTAVPAAPAAPAATANVDRPIATAHSRKKGVASKDEANKASPSGTGATSVATTTAPSAPSAPSTSLAPAPLAPAALTAGPAPAAVAPQVQVPSQSSSPKEPKVAGSVVHLPVEMEGVVYHGNTSCDFDGDVVMQDVFEAPMEVPKKLGRAPGRICKRRSKPKRKISAGMIRMAEEEIKRM